MLISAANLGFAPEAEIRDRVQMGFLAQLMQRGAARFILKGGMAMRALYGSARLTKDIDFDCEDPVSAQSMKSQIPKAIMAAARGAGIVCPEVVHAKAGDTSNRWRMEGLLPGTAAGGNRATFEVEISRRGIPNEKFVTSTTVDPPVEYRIQRFLVRAYTETAMAAGKVNALLSPNRNAPRDVYDLYDLIQHRASAHDLWVEDYAKEYLQSFRDKVWRKVGEIRFELAYTELLPYLSPGVRDTIDKVKWDHMCADVAAGVDQWFQDSIKDAKPASEINRSHDHDPSSHIDLARPSRP
jgi:predicted nucleotidyltransferase component of viral defense system